MKVGFISDLPPEAGEAIPNAKEGGMTPAELRKIGEYLYGPRWQTKLARELPVNPRTVRYWLSGKRKIRPVMAARIRALDVRLLRA